MKFKTRFLLILLLIAGVFAWRYGLLPQLPQPSDRTVSSRRVSQTASASRDVQATPVESIVSGKALSSTYHYQFQKNLSNQNIALFKQAVAAYNHTGIVKLIAGSSRTGNTLTFGSYTKAMPSAASTFELGHGGPQITETWSALGTSVVNHASAQFNVAYQSQLTEAVAMHELGHALGLDHATSTTSVMYPVDQGVSQLSAGDLAGLKQIYETKK
ncbi:matrixin family metalloprotease [Lacticaseibacillus porcinae]|uniref:matrixin family metalloprotease n=1 Tax=Lacticaseibacillus porcinae TaxID=1123687 RepID=UPI000F7A7023|nr:matrixin family metalloprotease [Lacticaseibacillus porcinae]